MSRTSNNTSILLDVLKEISNSEGLLLSSAHSIIISEVLLDKKRALYGFFFFANVRADDGYHHCLFVHLARSQIHLRS